MASAPERTRVAGDVFTYCTREKIETWHVVRNHNAQGIVDRVICKSCSSEHKFKMPEKAKAVLSTGARVIRKSPSGALPVSSNKTSVMGDHWFSKVKAWGEKPIRKYQPTESYEINEIIEHPSFSKGVVEKLRDNKMEVLFREGLKVLPCKKKSLGLFN